MGGREFQPRGGEGAPLGLEAVELVERPEAQGGEHLVVATAPGMDLPGDGAESGGEAGLDRGVDVLLRAVDDEGSGLHLAEEHGESAAKGLAFLRREEPRRFEHAGVRRRADHVVAGPGEVDRGVVAHREVSDRGVEGAALVPETHQPSSA